MGEPLLVKGATLVKNRLDRGRVLVLQPSGLGCPESIKVITRKRVFSVSAVEFPTLVSYSWISMQLGLGKVEASDLNSGSDVEDQGLERIDVHHEPNNLGLSTPEENMERLNNRVQKEVVKPVKDDERVALKGVMALQEEESLNEKDKGSKKSNFIVKRHGIRIRKDAAVANQESGVNLNQNNGEKRCKDRWNLEIEVAKEKDISEEIVMRELEDGGKL
ncbi:hypothetical protein QYF36_004662 [Acer negundo]|nr:hypothetical protein QYF36_004662 [Acer negundo]